MLKPGQGLSEFAISIIVSLYSSIFSALTFHINPWTQYLEMEKD